MPLYAWLQLLFFVTELSLLLFRRSKQSTAKNKRDRRSLLILWVVIAGCLSLGPWAAAYRIWPFDGMLIGTIIYVLGFIIRWTAVYQLGKMFTVDVAIANEHTLKTNGLYNVVRHPSYLGLILIILGLGICLNSVLSFIIMFVPTFIAISYRITVEEKALTEEFGDQYTNYKSNVKRLIPGVY
jgi:protein-S-isoprenylcysteine O-methyltransferase Ste14